MNDFADALASPRTASVQVNSGRRVSTLARRGQAWVKHVDGVVSFRFTASICWSTAVARAVLVIDPIRTWWATTAGVLGSTALRNLSRWVRPKRVRQLVSGLRVG